MPLNKLLISSLCLVLIQILAVNCAISHLLLFTPSNVETPYVIEKNNLQNSPFSRELPLVIIIHGFSASANDFWVQESKNEFLKKAAQNVLLVNWEEGARPPNYIAAKSNMLKAAAEVNQFLLQNQIDPANIYCVGHSLGAHACGNAAKGMKFKRITGMDPAGPLFESDDEHRLNKTLARTVDIINTDGCLGLKASIGHYNFYPNGGDAQPGCLSSHGLCDFLRNLQHPSPSLILHAPRNFVSCSHSRSHEYFLNSLKSNCFKARKCDSYASFEKGECDELETAQMGFDAVTTKDEGDYFLKTSVEEPFCLE